MHLFKLEGCLKMTADMANVKTNQEAIQRLVPADLDSPFLAFPFPGPGAKFNEAVNDMFLLAHQSFMFQNENVDVI